MRKLLKKAVEELALAGCETPQLDAEVLLAHTLGCERHEIYIRDSLSQTPATISLFQNFLERRKKREPVAYIVGYKEFWSMKMKVTNDVLIPCPETEALIEKSLKILRTTQYARRTTILDLCTGSGCIAAALAKEIPTAHFTVTDISAKALEIAKENLAFTKDRVTFIQSNLFEKITGKFDLIISNPPYLSPSEIESSMPEVRLFEPRIAIDGGADGLDFISKILQDASRFLNPDGWLILENGAEIQTWNISSLKGASNSKERFRSTELKILSSL